MAQDPGPAQVPPEPRTVTPFPPDPRLDPREPRAQPCLPASSLPPPSFPADTRPWKNPDAGATGQPPAGATDHPWGPARNNEPLWGLHSSLSAQPTHMAPSKNRPRQAVSPGPVDTGQPPPSLPGPSPPLRRGHLEHSVAHTGHWAPLHPQCPWQPSGVGRGRGLQTVCLHLGQSNKERATWVSLTGTEALYTSGAQHLLDGRPGLSQGRRV